MTETCWNILGIEPTHDERVIKKAYALKLRDNKPDKNPAGFRALREAYEQALSERYWYEEYDEEKCDDEYDDKNNDVVSDDIDESLPAIEPQAQQPQERENTVYLNDNSNDVFQDHQHHQDNQDSQNGFEPIDDSLSNKLDKALDDAFNTQNQHLSNDDYSKDTAFSNTLSEQSTVVDQSIDENSYPLVDAQSQLIQWFEQWDQSILDPTVKDIQDDKDTVAADLDEDAVNKVDLLHSYADYHIADETLAQHLNQQFEQLTDFALDDISDYEQALIVFFEHHPKAYSESYFLAKSHFDWQQRIDSWDNYEYPWYLLRSMDESYSKIAHFDTKNNFLKYIASKYPMVYQHWDFTLPELVVPRKWQFIREFFWPHIAYDVKQQLNNLKQELTYYKHSEFDTDSFAHMEYWLNHPQLKTLDKRLGIFGVINLIDFIAIGLGCWVVFEFLGSVIGYQTAFDDGLQSWLIISLFYIYWQFQLNIFTHSKLDVDFIPDNFFLVLQAVSLFLIFPLALEAIQNPSLTDTYEALHLFSFIFILIWALRQGNIIEKVLLILNATLLFIVVGTISAENINPIVWLLFSIPIIVQLLKSKTRFSMIFISKKMLSALVFMPLITFYLLAFKTIPLLLNQGLLVSSLLLIVGVMLIMGMTYKAISYFKIDA